MRTAILSDIHANLEALESVVSSAADRQIDRWICLGDIVGYGADPGACIELTRSLAQVTLLGNHDAAVAGLQDVTYFNTRARQAVDWTRRQISPEERDFLAALPLLLELDNAFYVHAEPADPDGWGYIHSARGAATAMRAVTTRLCFVGHSHEPLLCLADDFSAEIVDGGSGAVSLEPNGRYLVNVGSVGQPRDGDSRFCFVIHDGENDTVEFVRIEYDIEAAAAKIIAAGLPEYLARRLESGH
jgi:diadenosine tetraphosphatase ApaH/serine/threonine PP2A family protein phosphatase